MSTHAGNGPSNGGGMYPDGGATSHYVADLNNTAAPAAPTVPATPLDPGAPGSPGTPAVPIGPAAIKRGAPVPVGYDPSVILGPDGNIYGYQRVFDAATGNYTYNYANFGPATDLATAATKSGIPASMLQQAVDQQRQQLQTTAWQGQSNPYAQGQTNQDLSQQLDALRNFQQYQQAVSGQRQTGVNGMTVSQLQDFNSGNSALNDYQQNAWRQGSSQVGGMSNADLQYAAQGYGNQQGYQSGVNYNQVNPYGPSGMTNGQLQLTNDNQQNALDYRKNAWSLGSADYTGGQSRQQYGLGTQDLQNVNDRSQAQFTQATDPTRFQAQMNDWTRTNSLANKYSNISYAGNGQFSATDYNGNHMTLGAGQLTGNPQSSATTPGSMTGGSASTPNASTPNPSVPNASANGTSTYGPGGMGASATGGELQTAQQDWTKAQHQYGMMQRASDSRYLTGENANTLNSTIAGM